MKLAFTINDLSTEMADYTTTHLARCAVRRGHQVWYIEVGNFGLLSDGTLLAKAIRVPESRYSNRLDLLTALHNADNQDIDVGTLDVLFLRNDPAQDALIRPWAQLAGVNFGRLAQQAGVVVVNNPDGLYHAVNKLYLQLFPTEIRPKTLISRDPDAVKDFLDQVDGMAVVKPLRGSGGHNVFFLSRDDRENFQQICEVVRREGYMIVQEYLPEAPEGDTRLFLLEGEIFEVDGIVAALRRVPTCGDLRSNLRAGGHAEPTVITERQRNIAKLARTQLKADGMFFVGLDIIGNLVVEVNVFSPGALCTAGELAGVDFGEPVIVALERQAAKCFLQDE